MDLHPEGLSSGGYVFVDMSHKKKTRPGRKKTKGASGLEKATPAKGPVIVFHNSLFLENGGAGISSDDPNTVVMGSGNVFKGNKGGGIAIKTTPPMEQKAPEPEPPPVVQEQPLPEPAPTVQKEESSPSVPNVDAKEEFSPPAPEGEPKRGLLRTFWDWAAKWNWATIFLSGALSAMSRTGESILAMLCILIAAFGVASKIAHWPGRKGSSKREQLGWKSLGIAVVLAGLALFETITALNTAKDNSWSNIPRIWAYLQGRDTSTTAKTEPTPTPQTKIESAKPEPFDYDRLRKEIAKIIPPSTPSTDPDLELLARAESAYKEVGTLLTSAEPKVKQWLAMKETR